MSYPLTREVFELFTKPYRQTAEITFNGVEKSIKLTEKNLKQGGLTYTKSSVSGDKVEIGSAICAEVTLILDNRDGRFDGVKFEGAELYIRIGIKKWDAHRWEKAVMHYVPLGYFTVDESPRKLSEITLSAFDRMAQFDKPVDFSALSFPMSLYELVSKACEVCRVPVGIKSGEMLNAGYIISAAPENSESITWRQIIQRAAEISGSCAYIDRDGQLRFGWYNAPEEGYNPPITLADRFSSDLYENEITLTGVTVEDDENIYLAGAEGCTLDITENFLIQHDHAAVAKSIWDKLGGFFYTPFSAQIKSLPHYDPLDMLTFVDKKGGEHKVIVTDTGFTLNGAASLEGRGETETSSGYAALDPLTQRERDILSKMEKRQQRELTNREQAIIEFNNTIWNSLGLHATEEESPNGGKVYYYHDGETLADSTIIYTFRAGGFAWTNKWEGEDTVWQYGFTRDGNAIVNILSAYKLQAEQIEAGSVTAEKLSVEYKSDLAKGIEDSVNAGMGTVRQEFKAADGVLKSSISEEISTVETRVTEGYGEAVDEEKRRALGAESGLGEEISGEAERAKGAENTLTETITQTETRLSTKIEQTAEDITLSVEKQVSETKTEVTTLITDETERAQGAEAGLSGDIGDEAERAKGAENALGTRITETETALSAQIELLPDKITQTVSAQIDEKVSTERSRAEGAEGELKTVQETHTEKLSELEVGVNGIKATVSEQTETITEQGTRLEKAESSIEETAGKIDAKVSKGDICAQIKLETTEDGADVEIKGNHLIVDSDNFKLSRTGEVTAKGTFTSEENSARTALSAGGLSFYYDGSWAGSIIGGNTANVVGPQITVPQNRNLIISNLNNANSVLIQNGVISATEQKLSSYLRLTGGLVSWGTPQAEVLLYNSTGSMAYLDGNLYVTGSIGCGNGGNKNKVIETANFGTRLLAAVESPLPMFTDIGSGTVGENGEALVPIDLIFIETTESCCEYFVFLTQTSGKKVECVFEKASTYFIVRGEPGATFDWAIYAPQICHSEERFEEADIPQPREIVEADTSVFEGETCSESALMEYVKSLAEKDALLAVSGI